MRRLPWFTILAVLVFLGIVAEYGYRFYDQQMSAEVRIDGIRSPRVLLTGTNRVFTLSYPYKIHFLRFAADTQNATETDAEFARRHGFSGTLTVSGPEGSGHAFKIPVTLKADTGAVVKRSSVESALFTESSVGIGTRFDVDYAFVPTQEYARANVALFYTTFPPRTPLRVELDLDDYPAAGVYFYPSCARYPVSLFEKISHRFR